eukprot:SM000065S20166  [mRNA]  locus=s65:85997:89065:+ [translate_table: standard]
MAAAGVLIPRCAARPLASLGGLALLRRPLLFRRRRRCWSGLLAALLVSPTRHSPRSPPRAAHELCRSLLPGPCLAALDELASNSASSSGTGVAAGRPEVHTGPLEEQQPRRRKKKVAIWIGYVGTDFKAVEGELEKAILAAGAMLPSNFGDFAKSKWGRSSRTDKGVHSVATVVGMKMEVPYDAWVGDEDGARLAASINEHLSSSIRVFSVQPVNKSFSPRRACRERTYHYLIPAAALEIDAGTALHEVNNRLSQLRAILASFEGKHPFHNYTSRSNYRPVQNSRPTAVAPPVAPQHTPQSSGNWDSDGPASASVGEDLEFGGKRGPAAPERSCTQEAVTRQLRMRESDLLDEDADMPKPNSSEGEDEVLDLRSRRYNRKAWWIQQPEEIDKIVAAHYRIVKECSCAHLEEFQGRKFARVVIVGESFMIYQIRKMMGTAIATLRGVLSPDILPVSLARHSRIPLPLAPAEGLVLTGSTFFPLRQQAPTQIASNDTVSVSLSAECDWGQALVKLSPRAQEEADTFLAANVLTAMAAPLTVDKAPWKVWLERLHDKPWLSAEDVKSLVAAFTSWQVAVQSRKDGQANLKCDG